MHYHTADGDQTTAFPNQFFQPEVPKYQSQDITSWQLPLPAEPSLSASHVLAKRLPVPSITLHTRDRQA